MKIFGDKELLTMQAILDEMTSFYGVSKAGIFIDRLSKFEELVISIGRGNTNFEQDRLQNVVFLRRKGLKNDNNVIYDLGKCNNLSFWLVLNYDNSFKFPKSEDNSKNLHKLVEVLKSFIEQENRYYQNIFKQFEKSYNYIYHNIIDYIICSDLSARIMLNATTKRIYFPDTLKERIGITEQGFIMDFHQLLSYVCDDDALDLAILTRSIINGDIDSFQTVLSFKYNKPNSASIYAYVANKDNDNKPVIIYLLLIFDDLRDKLDNKYNISNNFDNKKYERNDNEEIVGNWEYNRLTKIISINQQTMNMFQFDKSEISFDDFSRYARLKIKDYYLIFLTINNAFQKYGSFDNDIEIQNGNNLEVYRIFGLDVTKEETNERFVVGYIKNITKIKEKEFEELKNQKMLSLGSLASSVAHDFNNILMATFGYIDFLKSLEDLPKVAYQYLNKLEKVSKIQADSVSKLLNYTKETKFSNEKFDLKQLITDVNDFSRMTFAKTVSINFDTDLSEAYIRGNRSSIQNALFNLYVNSKDAMNSVGTISVRLSKIKTKNAIGTLPKDKHFLPGSYYLIDINDTGSGIDEKVSMKMFDQFYTTKEKNKGTGLGLCNVLDVITSSSGMISYETSLGFGTTFHIYLPIVSNKNVVKENMPVQEEVVINEKLYTILVIDDDPLVNSIIQESLKTPGYIVHCYTNQFQALEFFKFNYAKLDLIILDMLMPGMNGDEVLNKMFEIYHDIKVVMLSGFNKETSFSEKKITGIIDYLQKPILPRELINIVKNIIGKTNEEVIDKKLALSMLNNNEKIFKKMAKSYIETFSNIEDVLNVKEDGRFEELSMIIHRLRGVSLNVGARMVYRLSNYIDEFIKNNNSYNGCINEINTLNTINKQTIEVLNKEI